jgi:hypothetical protein
MRVYATILDAIDPELGKVRLCRGCGETWPRDDEFFYFDARGKVMGHCRACWSERKRIAKPQTPGFQLVGTRAYR